MQRFIMNVGELRWKLLQRAGHVTLCVCDKHMLLLSLYFQTKIHNLTTYV